MQAQGLGHPAWFNATVDGKVLAQGGKWLIPLDLQQWPKALPNRGTLELDVLQLPMHKAPWMKKNQVHICSKKDSEVLTLQSNQAECGDTDSDVNIEDATSPHTNKHATDLKAAAASNVDANADTAVNSAASVALQPALALA